MKGLKKGLSMVLTVSLICMGALAGCARQGSATGSSTATGTSSSAVASSAISSKETGSQSSFNPDTEKDTIPYDKLTEKYGPIPTDKLPKNAKIGAILKNLANEFWLTLGDGMVAEGKKYNVSVGEQASRTETDVEGQLSIAENMIEKNYSALILSPLTNNNLNSAVKSAKSHNIPIVNANCEYIEDCDTFVGGIQLDIGRKAADYIAKKLNGQGKVGVLEGVAGTFTSIQRVSGFKNEIKKYPQIKIVASVPADYETEKGMNVASDIITKNPDISALFCCNDNMALGAVEALRSANLVGKVIVTGADGTKDAYKSISKGELTATLDQFPDINGKAAVDVALRLMAGQKMPKVVSTPIEVVDKANMAMYKK